MEKIKRFIHGVVTTNGCNFKCDYCYLAQSGYKFENERKKALTYPLETVLKACSKERLGGTCVFDLVGDGETLFPGDIVDLVCGLIQEGHYLTIVTNGTVTGKMHEIVERLEKKKLLAHLGFSLSLHYIELKRLGLRQVFADNVEYLKKKGVSVSLMLTLGPSYLEIADEIQQYCKEELKMDPSVGIATRNHEDGSMEIMADCTTEEYYTIGDRFHSEIFERQKNMFNKKREGFCYAGDWSFVLNFSTGLYRQCIANEGESFNFFEKLEEPLNLAPVGNHCKAPFCICGYADTRNLIPENPCKYYDREKMINQVYSETAWINENMIRANSADLALTNQQYSKEEQLESERRSVERQLLKRMSEAISYDYQDEDYESVIKKAGKLLEHDVNPNVVWVVNLILKYGYALLNTGNEKRALDLESCYADMKYCGDYCLMMGLIFLRNGMIERAVEAFEEALVTYATLDEGTNTYLPNYNLGVIYECSGNEKKAIDYYKACGEYELAKKQLNSLLKEST